MSAAITAVVAGVGAALPELIVGNEFFTELGTSPEWIVSRTGIRERRWLGEDDSLAELAGRACENALADAGRSGADVDLVLAATITADRQTPGLAPEIARDIGAPGPGAADLSAACTGFLYALDYAMARIESGRTTCALVCGAEALSRITDRTDRATAMLFGDGAGAVVVVGQAGLPAGCCPQRLSFASNGQQIGILYADRHDRLVRMRGNQVYEYAVEAMASETEAVCKSCGTAPAELDLLVAHQANARIVTAVARELAVPAERAPLYIDRLGNTSAASIPLVLAAAQAEGRLRPGARVGLTAFGAGLTWGAGIINWKGCRHADRSRP
jgi:3-oxoacyl-[acyl-carrier-protein] synthase III